MKDFFFAYWDKLLLALIATYGAALSTYNLIQTRSRDRRDRVERQRNESLRVLWETRELIPATSELDHWIFEVREFSGKQRVYDALRAITEYWKRNQGSLEREFGKDARSYLGLCGLYEVAVQNGTRKAPSGAAAWLAVTQENLRGYTITQLLQEVVDELKKKTG